MLGRITLLPGNTNHGWLPYVLLSYLGFFFIEPIADRFTVSQWMYTAAGVVIFLVSYFAFYWAKDRNALPAAIVIALLGAVYTPTNSGATCFFIYAASFFGLAVEASFAAALIAALIVVISVEGFVFHIQLSTQIVAIGLSLVTGAININVRQRIQANCRLRLAQEEIENLAKIAERERIARDLHDILGHTLSVIILKSELASKLMDRDLERARSEILDVERTSRQALAEVRQAIGGFRALGLVAEIEQARATLATAGVKVECDAPKVELSATQESVLALAVKEATTNIVRHAKAATCKLQIRQQNGACYLQIQDDGCGTAEAEGNGLRGMRERVEALGGSLRREISNGTELHISLPLKMEG